MSVLPNPEQAKEDLTAYRNILSSAYGFLRDFSGYAGRKIFLAIALVAAGAVLEGVGLVLLIPLLSVIFGTGAIGASLQHRIVSVFDAAGADTQISRLAIIFVIFGFLMIARGVVVTFRDVLLSKLEIGFVNAKQLRIMECLATTQWGRLVRLRHARVTHVIGADIERVSMATHFLVQSAVSLAVLLVQCVLAFLLAPTLTLLVILLLTAGAFALMPVLRRARGIGEYLTDANLGLLDTTAQFLGGLKLAISQGLQLRFVGKFQDILRSQARQQIGYIRQQTVSSFALTASASAVAGILILMGISVFHIVPAVLTTLVAIIARMSGPVEQIQRGAQQLVHALPAYEKVKELEAELTLDEDRQVAGTSDPFPDGPIVFQSATFIHVDGGLEPHSKRGVCDLSLTIAFGEFLGVTGASGAGKTTFADLLVGLFAPQSGLILIGGVPLDAQLLPRWRSSLSYVSQDPFLFHETVRDNLTWSCPQTTDDEIWAALRLTGAETVVRRMDKGLDTVVGERGMLVSGGERQRLALTAALLRKPKLLVLDEATNAIDIASEQMILNNLRGLSPRPTIILIAHRAESLDLCERVFRLESSRIDLGQTATSSSR